MESDGFKVGQASHLSFGDQFIARIAQTVRFAWPETVSKGNANRREACPKLSAVREAFADGFICVRPRHPRFKRSPEVRRDTLSYLSRGPSYSSTIRGHAPFTLP